MTELDELLELRPKLAEAVKALELERNEHAKTRQERDAERSMNAQLRASLVALREAHRPDQTTPPMGVSSPETSAVVRRNREHA